jgi:hypothetical protein
VTATVDELVQRSAVLKQELVAYAWQGRQGRDLTEAVVARFGDPVVSTDEELAEFIDRFILSRRLSDDRTVLERFVRSRGELPRAERDVLLRWRDPLEGYFDVESLDGEALVCTNVIDELPYRIRTNVGPELFRDRVPPGSILLARVVPLLDEWLISGTVSIFTADRRDDALLAAWEAAHDWPALVFRNPAKLESAWRQQGEDRAAFVAWFGSDQVVVPGAELVERWAAFWAHRYGDGAPPYADLSELVDAATVGLIYDEQHGFGFYAELGRFEAAFAGPERARTPDELQVVEEYLRDDSVNGVPLLRCARQYPEAVDVVLAQVLRRPRFRWARDGDELLRRFKPGFLDADPLPQFLPLSEQLVNAARLTTAAG